MPKHIKNQKPLFVRLTPDEHKKFMKAKQHMHFISMSDWVRYILHKTSDEVLHEVG